MQITIRKTDEEILEKLEMLREDRKKVFSSKHVADFLKTIIDEKIHTLEWVLGVYEKKG